MEARKQANEERSKKTRKVTSKQGRKEATKQGTMNIILFTCAAVKFFRRTITYVPNVSSEMRIGVVAQK